MNDLEQQKQWWKRIKINFLKDQEHGQTKEEKLKEKRIKLPHLGIDVWTLALILQKWIREYYEDF